MANFELTVPDTSMYLGTQLLRNKDAVFFGLWNPPTIILDGDEEHVRLSEQDKGRLDRLAYERLQTRTLAWAIAVVNHMDYVPRDAYVGRDIVIPKRARIDEALQKVTGGR